MPKLLGIDPGRRWVGLATSDASQSLASPYRTLDRRDNDLLDTLRGIVNSEDVGQIIVGYPEPLKVDENERTREVDAFIDEFVKPLECPFETVSERYSTKEAERMRQQRDEQGTPADEEAAAVILQTFIDRTDEDDSASTNRSESRE